MLTVHANELEGAPLFTISGRFDGAGAVEFDKATGAVRNSVAGPVLLDMAGVDYLSSAGLRSFMLLAKARKAQQSRVWIIAALPTVLQVFELSGLLNQYDFFTNQEEAAQRIRSQRTSRERGSIITPCGREHVLSPLPNAHSMLDRWPSTPDRPLTCLALDELGTAIGRAGLGNTSAQASQALGAFLATGHMASVRPLDTDTDSPDFVITEHPSTVPVYVKEAWQIKGTPAAFVTANDGVTTVAEVLASFPELLRQATGQHSMLMAWIIAAQNPDDAEGSGWISIGCSAPGEEAHMEAVRVSPLALNTAHEEVAAFLKTALHLETLAGAYSLPPEQRIGRYVAWLYAPKEIRMGADHRLQVTFEDVQEPPEEWDWIARRIYSGTGSMRLRQLCGGYSAVTFHVESYDEEGRRLLPTVLKISDPAFSAREDRAYDLYVSKYILNNSAVRMGRCARNEWVGLRYNFLGITGPESRLSWIGDHLVKRPISESMPLFRDLFEKILAPWYGQARPCEIKPYHEHDPRKLFKGLGAEAEKILGISTDRPYIHCPLLNRDLPNPYYVLEHIYDARADAGWPGMSSIVHGDLNLNNVLVDEKENMYVIDFSETHIGELCGDFTRIEPLVLLQMTRMENDGDVAALLRYLYATSRPECLFNPPDSYDGDDPFMPKAQALVHLLREEAGRLAGDRRTVVPYLLGLLRWSLPTVVFRQLSLYCKKGCFYASAILCEALLEADPVAAELYPPKRDAPISS